MKSVKEQLFRPMIDAYHKIENAYIKRLKTNGVLNKIGVAISGSSFLALIFAMSALGVSSAFVIGLGIGAASLTTLTSAVLIARHVYANKKFKSDVRSFEEDYRVPFDSIPEVEEQLFIEKEAQEMFGYLEQTPKVEEIKKVVKQKKSEQKQHNEPEDEEARTR